MALDAQHALGLELPGTAIEVWPVGTRVDPAAANDLCLSDLPLPERWPHHGYITSDAADTDAILAAFAREGWKAEKVHNGPPGAGFSLVRAWIENHTGIEIGGSDMRAQYERFFRDITARAA